MQRNSIAAYELQGVERVPSAAKTEAKQMKKQCIAAGGRQAPDDPLSRPGSGIGIDTYREAVGEMLAGRLDLVFGYSMALEKVLFKNSDAPRLEFVGPDYEMPAWLGRGLVVRKGDDALRQAPNAAITEVAREGTYQTIQSRYFGYDVRPQ